MGVGENHHKHSYQCQGSHQAERHNQKVFSEKDNRVRATPVFGFFDLTGKRISRFIGRTSGVDEFLLLGQYVAEGHHEKMSFLKVKRQQKKAGKG